MGCNSNTLRGGKIAIKHTSDVRDMFPRFLWLMKVLINGDLLLFILFVCLLSEKRDEDMVFLEMQEVRRAMFFS